MSQTQQKQSTKSYDVYLKTERLKYQGSFTHIDYIKFGNTTLFLSFQALSLDVCPNHTWTRDVC